jgi:hypothetical protein
VFSQIDMHVPSTVTDQTLRKETETRTTASPHVIWVSGACCIKVKSLDIVIEMMHEAINMGEACWFGP